jgi:polar amino acid transport system permease protein
MTAPETSHEATDAPVFVRRRHPSRWVGYIVIAFIVFLVGQSLITNPRFQWPVVFGYFFDSRILAGLGVTIFLTVVSMIVGFVIGIILAAMRVSQSGIFRNASGLYIWFFRGTPVLVQLVFWYNLGYLYPNFTLGIPFMDPWFSTNVNEIITPLTAALLGLSLNEGAYLAEIVRAGILAVPRGQAEAATSLGMTRFQSFRLIVLPQAMRVIVPPTGNETIGMLKTTSLVSVIALADLMYSAQSIYSVTFETIPLLICASLWYLLLTTLLSIGQSYVERYFGRGTTIAVSEKSFTLRLPKLGSTR